MKNVEATTDKIKDFEGLNSRTNANDRVINAVRSTHSDIAMVITMVIVC